MFLKQQQCEQIKEKDELRRARKLANEEMQVDAEYESMFFNRCSKLEQNLRQEEKYRIQDFNKLLVITGQVIFFYINIEIRLILIRNIEIIKFKLIFMILKAGI